MSNETITPTLIMAVPWDQERARRAVHNAKEVGNAQVVWDKKHSIQDTFLRALRTAGEEGTIFMQDDVFLHPQWRQHVEEAIANHSGDVIQFFSIRKSDLGNTSRYEPGRNYLMNQCFYLPPGVAKDLHDYAQTWFEANPGHTGDDTCVSDYLRFRKMKYWHHVPSLVQHEPWTSVTGKGRSTRRQSPTFDPTIPANES